MQSTTEKHKLPTTTTSPKRLSHVTPSPIVFCSTNQDESDSSFNHYIGNQFQPYSGVLQERASLSDQTTKSVPKTQVEKQDQPIIKQQEPINKVQVEDKITNITTINNPAIVAALTTLTAAETIPNTISRSYNNEERGQQQEEVPSITDPWWVLHFDEDGFYSIGMVFFLFGFICPPLWWIGSCWPRHPREQGGKMAERWQKLNIIMSLGFSVILIIAFIYIAVLYSQTK
ncbi:hypothetical protein INT45_013025 [Circinella minor]|uniref:Uncharacterized protein n=1 Tax=Circinella minor TaxID=1195481 RepID=A0A8H7VFA2_9FUNG|nr:hypothetical protein INT45_013025 [Circinella minor]